ncbi:DUF4114 domain-containing protein [Mesoflavibacter profundi]|uniref:DUF4114 domain-containing protein n=1 Tax=Mesoflavibacter profundi TaxID=2708110 RepID=A0ABT4S0N4_9FLAO|nr:DUF4114 domain-containing protein [Mesoflavibacter profundi]MDA0177602.1 DUF4114 domain-containing protein [Mesoflavibacter profundi]
MKQLFTLLILTYTIQLQAQTYQYLGTYTTDGTPNYLEPIGDVVSVETLEMISNSLPESYPVPEYNPHYITSGYDTNLEIEANADVWVTFVSEGAGYKNVLGYYTYDVNNPPTTTPQPEDITIIFPNVSALGSGGGLLVGDKVKIGSFTAGTGIGWVLLANAWNSNTSTVGNGLWQLYSNPEFNPEAQPELQHHNVLLNDPDNQRIILGFEDIRRDYGSCDNDFNDAVFYVTANPYTALRTTNYADVASATDVTSANDGGLESNGNLATLIAKRNFKRTKTGEVYNTKRLQNKFEKSSNMQLRSSNALVLANLIPDTGMYGVEQAYESSPEDLLGITNAVNIFSADFYKEDLRLAAVLATETEGSIYDHSKVICDRLNSSVLEDIRTVMVKGHQMISSKILRQTGETEFTLSFSVKKGMNNYELFSFWNIDQYPEGDYYNFQIWGHSFSQVFFIANHVLDQLNLDKPVVSQIVNDVLPPVFVSSGYYSNGQIHLNLINKTAASSLNFNASIAPTEVNEREDVSQTVALNGDWHQSITLQTGSLFDIGFSLSTSQSAQIDALYLADGPWGIDYLEDYASIDSFTITNHLNETQLDEHFVERQPTVTGNVTGNVNLFRHILPGDQTLNILPYQALEFEIQNNLPIEIVVMPKHMADWNNRLRYTIPANANTKTYNIAFEDFKNANNQTENIEDIKTVVFSVIGDYSSSKAFNLSVNHLKFTSKQEAISNNLTEDLDVVKVYPNPVKDKSNLIFNLNSSQVVNINVYDQLGKRVFRKELVGQQGLNTVNLNLNNLNTGMYICTVTSVYKKFNPVKLIVN